MDFDPNDLIRHYKETKIPDDADNAMDLVNEQLEKLILDYVRLEIQLKRKVIQNVTAKMLNKLIGILEVLNINNKVEFIDNSFIIRELEFEVVDDCILLIACLLQWLQIEEPELMDNVSSITFINRLAGLKIV